MSSEDSQSAPSRLRLTDLLVGASLAIALGALLLIDRVTVDQSSPRRSSPGLLSETELAANDPVQNQLPDVVPEVVEPEDPTASSVPAVPEPEAIPDVPVVEVPEKTDPPQPPQVAEKNESPTDKSSQTSYELPSLPARSNNDETVDRFIQFDVGQLRGQAGNEARLAFNRIGNEAIPALIRGLNKAATIHASCPVIVLQGKLNSLLQKANDPKMYELAIAHIGDEVPTSAPYYRRIISFRDGLSSRLPVSHPLRKQSDIIAQMRSYNEQQLREAMENPSAQIRLLAVRTARMRRRRMGSEFMRLLRDASADIRKESHMALVQLARDRDFGSTVGQTGDELDATLANWRKWWSAEQAKVERGGFLKKMRRYSNEQLRNALLSKDVGERWAAASLVHTKRLPFFEELIQLLRDEDDSVRFEARQALAQSADGVDYGPKDSASEAEVTAVIAKWTKWLSRHKLMPKYAKADLETIRSAFKSAESVDRWAAVTTARLQKTDIPSDFIGLLQDGDLDIRQEARHALVQLSDGSDFGPSENATIDEQTYATAQWKTWLVRQGLVQRYENASRTTLISTLESSNLDDRWAVVTLIRRKQMDVPERLIRILTDPDPDVRQIARLCLVGLADGEDFGPEEDDDGTHQAIAVLRWNKWQRRREYDEQFMSMDAVNVAAAFKSANPLKRWAAVAVAKKRSLKVPRALISCLTDEEADVRRDAHNALVDLSGKSGFGPPESATPTQQAAAVKNWLEWWNRNYEEKARNQLKLAELLFSKGRKDRARPRLQSIIDEFPETRSAERARRLLKQ